ncbi:MAG TPA: class I SAM-dependent methyltransferase [Isosphaeraceae bacterium]|nr:class I SAM-dependent methyltransferase [Isosphaeraceae bacterium]
MAEYDPLAEQYRQSKLLPFRTHSEAHTHMTVLGDLAGKSVLDLACGEGYFSRRIREAGADRVVGVDVSEQMISMAIAEERQRPLGIEYRQGAAEDLGSMGPFDLVSAAYLLNCAPSEERLLAMCQTAAQNLKPGGRFVATNSNIGEYPRVDYRPYGLAVSPGGPFVDGDAYQITFLLGSSEFTIEDFYYHPETYDRLLRRTGFASIHWHRPMVSAEGLSEFGAEFWQTFIDSPPIVTIECHRGER